jgi:hypothetical protein
MRKTKTRVRAFIAKQHKDGTRSIPLSCVFGWPWGRLLQKPLRKMKSRVDGKGGDHASSSPRID